MIARQEIVDHAVHVLHHRAELHGDDGSAFGQRLDDGTVRHQLSPPAGWSFQGDLGHGGRHILVLDELDLGTVDPGQDRPRVLERWHYAVDVVASLEIA